MMPGQDDGPQDGDDDLSQRRKRSNRNKGHKVLDDLSYPDDTEGDVPDGENDGLEIAPDIESDDEGDHMLWTRGQGPQARSSWDEEELTRLAWDDDDNPWKRESVRLEEERRFLETKVMRLENKIMALNAELNRIKSPPMIVGTVVESLKDGLVIVSTTGGPTFLVKSSSSIVPEDLKIGTKVSMNKDTMSIISILPSSKDPLVGAAELEVRPETTFRDVGGLDRQIEELREVIELPLIDPDAFRDVGIDPPKGVLLIGPPGCGKTLLAKAIANKTRATFLRIVGSELVQKYIGEGSRMVRELFDLARERAPSILFLDEIDSIAGRRTDSSTSADREVHRTLIQLLAELDGFDPLGEVRIIAATNRPDILDPAILRPGRIDRIIEIPQPDMSARVEIYRVHSRRMNLDKDITMESLAILADDLNGAQIKASCTEAGLFAIRDGRRMVIFEDFKRSVKKVREGANSTDIVLRERSKNALTMFA